MNFAVQRQKSRQAILDAQMNSALTSIFMPIGVVMAIFNRSWRDELGTSIEAGSPKRLIRTIGAIYGFEDSDLSFQEIETAVLLAKKGIHLLGQIQGNPFLTSPMVGIGINALSLKTVGTMAMTYFELKLS